MDIILQDGRKFKVEGYLHEQGKSLIGSTPRHWANMFVDRSRINLRIRDNETGEENEFNVAGMLEENGTPIDYQATFDAQQEAAQTQRKQARIKETFDEETELRKLQQEEGTGQAFKKMFFPFQWQREKNVAAGKDEPSTMKDVWAASLDFFSMLPRQTIAAAEAGLYEMTSGERGRPFTTSLGRYADYGADVDPETGEEETLTNSMKTLQEAMRVDPKGVLADLAIESARDPLTGAHAMASVASLGTTGPISALTGGTRVGMMLAKVAKKYKTIGSRVNATSRFVQKTHEKLTKGGIAKRFAASVVGEGIEGGIQGVFTNYAVGENKNAWNTFLIEGVEESIFGAGMFVTGTGAKTALSAAWNGLSKNQKKNALGNVGEKARALVAKGIKPTPELLFGEVNLDKPAEGIGNAGPQTEAQALLQREQEAQANTPITEALPSGVPRKDTIKKIQNPMHQSPLEQQVQIEIDETERKVKKDLGKIETAQQDAIEKARAESEKAISDSTDEIDQEDAEEDELRQKNMDETNKLLTDVLNPEKATTFDTWDKVFGAGLSIEEKIRAFEDFRVEEQKRLDAVKERISPTAKEEAPAPAEPAGPKMIEEAGPIEIPDFLKMKTGDLDPWSVTKADYVAEHPGPAGELAHRALVQKAVSGGKEVPPEVLADYPDIEPASFDVGRKDAVTSELQNDLKELLSPEKFKEELEQFGPLGETTEELTEDATFAQEALAEAAGDKERAAAQARLEQAEKALNALQDKEKAGFTSPAKQEQQAPATTETDEGVQKPEKPAAPAKAPRAKGEKPQKIRTRIGQNSEGQDVYEDQNGVRSISNRGIFVSEAVALIPTLAGIQATVDVAERPDRFKTMAETTQAPANADTKFINIVDESKADEIIKRLKDRLRPGRLYSNPMFDPELWVDLVELGMIRAQQGINDFAKWSEAIISDLGREVKPFLQSAYNALQAYPRNVKFNPKIAVKLFEFGGITRQENGPGRANIEQALTDQFGPEAAVFTDFIHEGLEQYPSIQKIQELAYESDQATISPVTTGVSQPAEPGGIGMGEGVTAGEQQGPEGLPSGAADRPDIRPNESDEPGEPNPYGLDHGEAEGERNTDQQKEISQDVYVRQNMDLRKLPPVEMTPAARRKLNLEAAAILDRVKKDPASLTQEDRLILRQYTGQGGLDVSKLTDEELAGSLNQHYTSYQVAKAVWDIIEGMGFNLKGAEALEPTAGVGNFAGMAPRDVKWRLNEVDEIAGQIMNLLYPEAENSVAPFESYYGPQKDIVISNVPFLENRGKFAAREDNAKYHNIKNLHNYVMMKSIDQLRDNGLGVFITSTWTMDGKNPEFRKQLNQKAAVLAAIRIPMGAFSKNTQYAGSADLIILRKRTAAEMQNISAEERIQPEFVYSVPIEAKQSDGTMIPTTRAGWFETHRSQAIGEWKYGTSKGGAASSTALDVPKEDFEAVLAERFRQLREELAGKYVPEPGAALPADMVGVGEDIGPASEGTPKFGLEIKDGIIAKSDQYGRLRRVREESFKVKKKNRWIDETDWSKVGIGDKHLGIIVRLMETSRAIRDGIAAGQDIKFLQDRAKRLLDDYASLEKYHRQKVIKKNGKEVKLYPGVSEKKLVVKTDSGKTIHKTAGLQFHDAALMAYAGLDNRYWLLRSLYNKEMDGFSTLITEEPKYKKAPEPKFGNMKTAEGVFNYVMEKYGVFRTADAMQIFQGTEAEFKAEMMTHPSLNWTGEEFVHDRDYLVGNLRDKIVYAEQMNLKNQLKKLRAALPKQSTAETIETSPTSTWWDYDALTAFGHQAAILGQGQRIERVREGLKTKFRVGQRKGKDFEIYNVRDKNDPLYKFVEVVLNQHNAMMPDPLDMSPEPVMIPDHKATTEIRNNFKKQFDQWAKTPGNQHAERASQNYNENFASKAVQDYSGEKMFIKGIATTINGRPFEPFEPQLSSVRMYRNQNGGILAHDVGNGKTLAAIFCFADALQSGKAKKVVVDCPAGTVGMWEQNFLQAMPNVKVKVIHGDGELRRADFMDAVANDYQVIIMAHGTMKRVPLRKSNVYIEQDLAEMRIILLELIAQEDATGGWSKRKVASQRKAVEKRIQNLQQRMEMNQKAERDMLGGVFYEDLGADMMIVDEGHNHKNTFEHTNEYAEKQFLKLGKKSSHMADDLQHKTRYVHEINNRGGVLMLTATPTPNSIIEIYSMIKFVAPWEWEQRGIRTVDDFIRNFVDIGAINQATITGTSADKEGVLGYKNGKALNDIVRTWVDYKKATPKSQVGRPEVEDETLIIEPNDIQMNMLGEIAVLASMSYKELLELGINPVTITTRAKALAVDPAFADASIVDEYPSFYNRSPKLKAVMDGVAENFKARPDRVQMIFMEQYRIQDWKPMTDEGGNKLIWPAGFGVATDEDGAMIPPSWLNEFTEEQRSKIIGVMKRPINPYQWDSRFKDKKGIPKEFTEDMVEKIKPLFNEETGEIYIQERFVKQDLHQEIRNYAVNVLGMDPDRVFVVNGSTNNKPEDKTRIETLNYLEKMTLIIGNSVMSEGLNLQTKGDAIFHVDVPWEPKTITQRNGRMLRPRYDLDDKVPVKIRKYALRNSADRRLYEILKKKTEWNDTLIYGDWDNLDNSINNTAETGIDLSELLRTSDSIIDGYKMKYAIQQDGVKLKAAVKEAQRMRANLEKERNNLAEAVRKVEDAQERINAGHKKYEEKVKEVIDYNNSHPDKPKELPPPYDATHWQEVIRRNENYVASGPKFVEEAEKAYKPYEKIEHDYEVNQQAQSVWRDVSKNNFASMHMELGQAHAGGATSVKFEDGVAKPYRVESEAEGDKPIMTALLAWEALVRKTLPDLHAAYPSLSDMLITKILTEVPKDPEAAARQVYEYMDKHHTPKPPPGTSGQAGFSNVNLMIGIAGTPLTLLFPKTVGLAYGSWILYHAFRKAWRSEAAKQAGWSLWARLREMPGFIDIEPLIQQTMVAQQHHIAREEDEFKRSIKGLTLEERLRAADKIEDDSIQETPAVTEAAKKLQRIFLRVSLSAQKAGVNIPRDVNYYPRMLDFEMIQKMKADQNLLDENAVYLVESGQVSSILDAYGILLNFFDNSAEMRGERRRKETSRIMQSIMQRHPNIKPQHFMTIYLRMKQKYGTQIIGNLKYGRVAPKLLNKMYHRDPLEVMAKYLSGAWNTIVQREILGEGSGNAINQFLNANFPVVDRENPDRDEVASWFKKQLEGGSFAGTIPMKWSKKARSYQYWTKLISSPLAPAKNILGAFNLALPLAGGRSTVVGLVKGFADVRSGFRPARVAGAISTRMISELYGSGDQIEKTSFQKLAKTIKEWNHFSISEKFVRSFAFHAGRNMADRLWNDAYEKSDADAYKRLHDVLGQGRMTTALLNGELSVEELDLFGVFMANKIGGTTNAFDLARWMNTSEGRMLMQFHSMAITQTRTFKDEILKPAFRKNNWDAVPFVRWCMAVGISLTAVFVLQAGLYNLFGEDPPEDEESDNPVQWAWNAAMMSNMVFVLGMYGDLAAGMDTPDGVTPLVGTMVGPTVSTILNTTRDLGYFVGGDEERLKRIARREVPGLNFLTKMGVLPGLEPD